MSSDVIRQGAVDQDGKPVQGHPAAAQPDQLTVEISEGEDLLAVTTPGSLVDIGLLTEIDGRGIDVEATAIAELTARAGDWAAHAGRRLFAFVVALTALTVGSPVLLLIAGLIKLASPGPVLYAQRRLGRGGKHFRCWKFRTMVVDADERLQTLLITDADAAREFYATFKLQNDPRVTAIGRFLRKTSLDELPQLFNVLRGEMALVGPRPIVDAELPRYGAYEPVYLATVPGMTGLWQVSGRSDTTYLERVQMDVTYAADCGLARDLAILCRTALHVVRPHRSGAY